MNIETAIEMNLELFTESKESIVDKCTSVFKELEVFDIDSRVELINLIRLELGKYSPFNTEPVDCVQWVKSDLVFANDYNPNSVAPPEMKLLEHSIVSDGYTQPIVSWPKEVNYEVVDGFHRHRVGKESAEVRKRVHGYLPIVKIKTDREDLGDRMAATIRHNRARGEHRVDSMAEIVIELKRRFWSDEKIANELGMEPDEVLRLTQVTGLGNLFSDRDFSEAWEADTLGEIEGDELLSE